MIKVNYYGSFEWGDGYGTSNMHWAKYLEREGVKIYPHFTFETRERYWIEGDQEEAKILNRQFERQDIGIVETPPRFFEANVSKIKIGSTMTETDAIGQDWVDACNKMDYIVLPTEFQKKAFSSSGVKVPIKVIPFGTEFDHFPYRERPERDVFTFGSVGFYQPVVDYKDRKNFWGIIQAFVSEFERDEPVRLILKSTSPESHYFTHWKDPRIEVLTERVSRKKLADIYHDMDCFVFPSRGEGVGQPPREAMATGLPTIVTNWSSLTEIALPKYSYPLNDFKLEKRIGFSSQPGNWAMVDTRELMYWMRYVYENQKEARQKGYDGSQWIKKNFSWEVSAKKMKEFLLKC